MLLLRLLLAGELLVYGSFVLNDNVTPTVATVFALVSGIVGFCGRMNDDYKITGLSYTFAGSLSLGAVFQVHSVGAVFFCVAFTGVFLVNALINLRVAEGYPKIRDELKRILDTAFDKLDWHRFSA